MNTGSAQSPGSVHHLCSAATQLIALSQPEVTWLCQHQPWGCQQPLAQQDARSVLREITLPCLYQSHWDECHAVFIHLVPKDHLTQPRTALVQHLGGVRRGGWLRAPFTLGFLLPCPDSFLKGQKHQGGKRRNVCLVTLPGICFDYIAGS